MEGQVVDKLLGGAAVKPEVRDGNLVVTLGQLSPSADYVVRLSF